MKMKKTLLVFFLALALVLAWGPAALADGVSVTGVSLAQGTGEFFANSQHATVSLNEKDISVEAVLDEMTAFTSSNPGQIGESKWLGLLIATDQAITDLYYSADGASFSQLTQADVTEAKQAGAKGENTFVLWIRAEQVKNNAKTVYLNTTGSAQGAAVYTVKVTDWLNVNNQLTNITTNNDAQKVAKNADYTATLTAAAGYRLPAAITVSAGTKTLTAGTDYTYNRQTGELIVDQAALASPLTITGQGVAIPDLTNLTMSGSDGKTYISSADFALAQAQDLQRFIRQIPGNITSVTVTPTAKAGCAVKVYYGDQEITAANGAYTIALGSGQLSDIRVRVYAQNDETAFMHYTISLQRESSPFDLSVQIKGDDGDTYLSKSRFDHEKTSYNLYLNRDVENLELTVYFDDDDYDVTVKYDGRTIRRDDYSSSYYYYEIPVDYRDLGILRIIAEDRRTGESRTYVFDLYDEDYTSDEELEDIHVNIGDSYKTSSATALNLHPRFDKDITDYAVLIPYDSDYRTAMKVYMRLSFSDKYVDFVYEGSDVTLSDDQYNKVISIPAGDQETVEFSVDNRDYTITFYYADRNDDDLAELDDLAFRSKRSTSSSYDMDLSPAFRSSKTDYTLYYTNSNQTVYLYADAGRDMLIFVNDELMTGSYWAFDPDDYNKVTITVYAENREDSEKYIVDLSKESGVLSSLNAYVNSVKVTLSPSFRSTVYNYTASVSASSSTITFNFSSSSTVKIAKDGGNAVSKNNSASYNLNYGLNEFDFQVGSKHYYVNVYRQTDGSVASIVPSSQYISVNNGRTITIPAYNINGNNFVKLRSIAYLLDGTAKQFSISYNDYTRLISLRSGYGYTSVGGELTVPNFYNKAVVSKQTVSLNGDYVSPTAYNIDGYNYFLLRDLAALFDFNIQYSNATVYINTNKGYNANDAASDAQSDFDVDMKLLGKSETYISKNDFRPEDNRYSVRIGNDEKTLYLYVYFDDDDYTVSVKYDGKTIRRQSYSSTFYLYEIDVDTDDLDDIDVTVTDDHGAKAVYTFALR